MIRTGVVTQQVRGQAVTIEVAIEVDEDRTRVRSVTLQGDDLTADIVRNVRLSEVIPVVAADPEPVADDVAELWRAAQRRGLNPNVFLAQRLGINPTAAAQRVRRLRLAGALPPVRRGCRR